MAIRRRVLATLVGGIIASALLPASASAAGETAELSKNQMAATQKPSRVIESKAFRATTAENATLATWCKELDAEWIATNSIGSTLYVYHHHLTFCYNGSSVTHLYNRYSYFTNVAWQMQPDMFPIANSATPVPHWFYAESFFQNAVKTCVPIWGCYASNHPWSRITAYSNGTYTADGTAG